MTIKLSRDYLKSPDDSETMFPAENCYFEMTDYQVTVLAKAITEMFENNNKRT